MVSSSLGYGTSVPAVILRGRAVDAISKGNAVQFHTTADSRIAAIPDLTNTDEQLLQVELFDSATLIMGVAMMDAAAGEWVEVAVYGPVQALCDGTTDIVAGNGVAADPTDGVFKYEDVNAVANTEHSHGWALEGYTDTTDVLKWIFVDCIAKGVDEDGTATLFLGGRIIGTT